MNSYALPMFFFSIFFGLFACDHWIVVTTIQYPTAALNILSRMPGWKLVVVGDLKTPKDWYLENCEYLSPERQLDLGYELSHLLPWNHYSRKNIGYLYAIEHGAKVIYETDDDNEPIGQLTYVPPCSILRSLDSTDGYVNIYDYFGHPKVWPRGFPLNHILSARQYQVKPPSPCLVGVEQGVVNGNPDVDAIFRLTQNDQIQFDAKLPCFLPKEKFCPFNSQNTFFHSIAFFTLYIPSCTSMRVSDIWRGYISQRLLWECDARLVFSGPNAIQNRNTHSLLHDFSQEQSLYLQASAFVDFLKQWKGRSTDPLELIEMLFSDLVHNAFFDPNELTLLRAWLKDLQHVSYIPRLKLPSNSLLIERHEKVRAETSLYDDETGI